MAEPPAGDQPDGLSRLAAEIAALAAMVAPDAPPPAVDESADPFSAAAAALAELRKALVGERAATRQALIGFTDCSASLVNQCRSVAPQVLLAVAGVCVTCNEDVATAPMGALIEDAVSCTGALRDSHSALIQLLDQFRSRAVQTELKGPVFPRLASRGPPRAIGPRGVGNVAPRRQAERKLQQRFMSTPQPMLAQRSASVQPTRFEAEHVLGKHGRPRQAQTMLKRAMVPREVPPVSSGLGTNVLPGPIRQLGSMSRQAGERYGVRMSQSRQAQWEWYASNSQPQRAPHLITPELPPCSPWAAQ